MEQKFDFTDEIMVWNGRVLHRIVALKSLKVAAGTEFETIVEKGQTGGWLQEKTNLDDVGNSWVADGSIVCDDAFVKDDAAVINCSLVQDKALLYGHAIVSSSGVYDHGQVGDWAIAINAGVFDDAEMTNYAKLIGGSEFYPQKQRPRDNCNTYIADYAKLSGHAEAKNGATLYDYAVMRGTSEATGPVKIHGEALIEGGVKILDRAEVRGHIHANFYDDICGDIVLG